MRRLLFLVLLCASMAAAQPAAQPQFFHITPVRPVEELRKEALKAQPPIERRDFLRPDLVELVKLDPTIKLDIRYATNRNFLSTPVYEEARAFMQRPRLLLLDEPSLGLAPLLVTEIFRIIKELNENEGLTVLVVEQNAHIALQVANSAFVLEVGRVALAGPSEELQQHESVRRSYLGY